MAERYLFAANLTHGTEQDGGIWHEVVSVGSFFSPWLEKKAKPIETTPEMLAEMAANFSEPVPIDTEHARFDGSKNPEEVAARGWIEGVKVVGGKFLALIKWADDFKAYVETKKFRKISVEFGQGQDRKTGKPIGWVLIGASVTNHPFWDVPDLVMSVQAFSIYTAAANTGGAHSESLTSTREPVAPTAQHKEAIMPERIKAIALSMNVHEDKIEEAITALATERDTARTALATVTGERNALSAKVKEYEKAEATAKKERFTAALATAREGGLPAGNDEIALARWEMGEDVFSDYVKANSDVKTAPKGGNRTDTRDASDGKPLSRKEAGKQIEMLALAVKREDNTDFPTAYAKVEEMPEHAHLFATYNEDVAIYGDEDEV